MRPLLTIVLCACGGGLLLAAACTTDYQKGLDDPTFGDPNALAGKTQPGPAAGTTGDGGSSGSASGPICTTTGGTLVDAGACAVSFKTILAAFKTANCQSAAGCHGGSPPPNKPHIDPDDPNGTWAELTAFSLSNGKAYINPCSIDPTQSTISCNVNSAAPCGDQVMPPGLGLAANVVTDIDTWLKCGAPNN